MEEEGGEMSGILFVISSPSGAGKTTLTRALEASDEKLRLSVSATTRPKRNGEEDGRDYHFMSVGDFRGMEEEGGFVEWAEVFGRLYGTPKGLLEEALGGGDDVLLDIDWQGARSIREVYGEKMVGIFVLPPSAAALEERLRLRDGSAEGRMANAAKEISRYEQYDYVLVNDDKASCLSRARAIVAAEREKAEGLRRARELALVLEGELEGMGYAPKELIPKRLGRG